MHGSSTVARNICAVRQAYLCGHEDCSCSCHDLQSASLILASLLWPERENSCAQLSLQASLHLLRKPCWTRVVDADVIELHFVTLGVSCVKLHTVHLGTGAHASQSCTDQPHQGRWRSQTHVCESNGAHISCSGAALILHTVASCQLYVRAFTLSRAVPSPSSPLYMRMRSQAAL